MKKLFNIISVVAIALISTATLFATGINPIIATAVPVIAGSVAIHYQMKGNFTALFYNIVFISLFSGVLVAFAGEGALMVAGILFMLTLIPVVGVGKVKGVLTNEVLKTMFSKDLQPLLYPDNEFYKNSQTDENVALDAITVEIPQENSRPAVYKDPEIRPIPTTVPKDLKKTYDVHLYETAPNLITNINQDLLTYDKRAAKLRTHANELQTRIAEEIAISWFPTISGRKTLTTGATGGVTKTGMTGNRKKLTYQDFLNLEYIVKRMIKDDGKFCLLFDAELKKEILSIAEFKDFDKSGIVGVVRDGAIGKILNMNVYMREGGTYADNSQVVKPFGSALGANDRLSVLAWHPDYVRYAEGRNEVYLDTTVIPGMGGRRMNAAVRGGGTSNRLDEIGVATLIQDIV